MSAMRARVRKGRLLLDEPTSLPEGTEVDLVLDDGGDELDAEERAALNEILEQAWQSILSGRGKAAAELLKELR
ncbi:MAG TPA: hypothetical protein VNE16_15905 [Vicinamibacterales bacterium]|nr:hypothetical protein [Vicinamibacterales bacterium]